MRRRECIGVLVGGVAGLAIAPRLSFIEPDEPAHTVSVEYILSDGRVYRFDGLPVERTAHGAKVAPYTAEHFQTVMGVRVIDGATDMYKDAASLLRDGDTLCIEWSLQPFTLA